MCAGQVHVKKSSGSQRDSPGGGLHLKLNATITADDARRGHRCGYKCLNVVPRSATAPWCRQCNGPVRYHLLKFSCTSQTQGIPSSPKHAPCTVRSCQHGGPAGIHCLGMDRAPTSSCNCDQNTDAGRSVEDPSVIKLRLMRQQLGIRGGQINKHSLGPGCRSDKE
jgi:hypothetical protein